LKIQKLEIENFKPYSYVKLPPNNEFFNDGIFLINGKNSMGKSSLIEAVLWCILGDKILKNERKRALCIKNNQKKCQVKVIFDIGGLQYQITRILQKNKRTDGKIDSTALLYKLENNKFIPINRNISVDAEIEKLLGINVDSINRTIYVRQKEVDSLALANSTQMRTYLVDLFGLDLEFERIKKKFKIRIDKVETSVNELSIEISKISTLQTELENREIELEGEKKEINRIEQERKINKENLSILPKEEILVNFNLYYQNKINLEGKLTQLKNTISIQCDTLKRQKKKLDDAIEEENNLNLSIANNIKKLSLFPLKDIFDEIYSIQTSISNYKKLISDKVIENRLNISFDSIGRINYVKDKIDIDEKQIKDLKNKSEILNAYIDILQNKKTHKNTIRDVKNKSIIHILQKNSCPVCNTILDNKKEKMISIINSEILTIKEQINNIDLRLNYLDKEVIKLDHEIRKIEIVKETFEDIFPLMIYYEKNENQLQNILDQCIDKQITLANLKDKEYINNYKKRTDLLTQKITSDKIIVERLNKIEIPTKRNEYHDSQKKMKGLCQEEIELLREIKNNSTQLQDPSFMIIDIEKLLSKFECQNIINLISKRKVIETRISTQDERIEELNKSIEKKIKDIDERKIEIKKIKKKELSKLDKENELKHLKFLVGEIDGFVSKYVIERKLAPLLKHNTNFYLKQLTEGRFIITKIFSVSRKSNMYREAHGLDINLYDNKDRVDKDKDQLSGGDETCLGLSLRLAISKLMPRIKPFKDAETKPPLINSIILDEPMASLDPYRRNNLITILSRDKSFKQIFLITHTEIEISNCNLISISDEDGNRIINCTLNQLDNSAMPIQ
jgi:DNA repair exonuclease SbcCD ATPase subunit